MEHLVDAWGHLTPTGKRLNRRLGKQIAALVKPLVGRYPRCELEAMISETATWELVRQYSASRHNPHSGKDVAEQQGKGRREPKKRRRMAKQTG